MKFKIIFLLIILVPVLLTGCDKEKEIVDYAYVGTWVYVNNSGYEIAIDGHFTHSSHEGSVTIPVGKSESLTYGEMCGKNPDPADFGFPVLPNNVRITYDDDVTETPALGEVIFDRSKYEVEKLTDYHYKFTYVFTVEDYKRACGEK